MSKPSPKFSMDDLVKQLQTLLPSQCNEGVRTVEIAAALNVSETTARKILNLLKAEGKVEVVRMKVEALDGKSMTVRAYRINLQEEA